MKIWYDDIVYSLQKAGGISVMWSHITNQHLWETYRFKYKGDEANSFSKDVANHNYITLSNKFIRIKRYLNFALHDEKTPFLFHSSYYRYCTNKNAINITTIYDFIYEYYDKRPVGYLHKLQKRNAVMHSEGVICISESTKRDLLKFYPQYKGKIRVIYCGYDTDTYYYESIKKEKIVIFIGARGAYKRFDLAVKILRELKDCKLIIIGGGELNETEKVLLEQGLFGRYEKRGYLTNDELRNLYNRAFFLLYCSDYEGFGIPPIEAQACGCPVVCQARSSIPEVVGDSAIFINPDNMSFTLKSIKELYNQDFYSKIVKKGLDNVSRFSWSKCKEDVISFYNEILDDRGIRH